ncbi:MAG: TetR/AcrR family transcriptional regulator [Pseudomonadota bacterium]
MKTRDRILAASLDLFNSEGEANVTALDVANVLEISPGNLYYHFKGKDALILTLFDGFEAEMDVILQGADGRLDSLEDHWVFLYILLEEIHDFRFFYRSLGLLTERYPTLSNRLSALNGRLRATLEASLEVFGDKGLFARSPRVKSVLLDQVVSTLTFWLEEDVVHARHTPPAELIHKTVLRTLMTVAPYLPGENQAVHQAMLNRYDRVLG